MYGKDGICQMCNGEFADGWVKIKKVAVKKPAWIKGKKVCQRCWFNTHKKWHAQFKKLPIGYEGGIAWEAKQ